MGGLLRFNNFQLFVTAHLGEKKEVKRKKIANEIV